MSLSPRACEFALWRLVLRGQGCWSGSQESLDQLLPLSLPLSPLPPFTRPGCLEWKLSEARMVSHCLWTEPSTMGPSRHGAHEDLLALSTQACLLALAVRLNTPLGMLFCLPQLPWEFPRCYSLLPLPRAGCRAAVCRALWNGNPPRASTFATEPLE